MACWHELSEVKVMLLASLISSKQGVRLFFTGQRITAHLQLERSATVWISWLGHNLRVLVINCWYRTEMPSTC